MSSPAPSRVVREFSEAELSTLSTMLSKQLFGLRTDRISVELETGRLQAFALIMFPAQALNSFIAITPRWFQTPVDNYHVFEIGNVLPAVGLRIVERDNGQSSIDSGGHVQFKAGRYVRSIDIVSYEHKTYWADNDSLADVLKYDRALVFEFDQGAPLTLTTDHGRILGAIEIKSGRSPGFGYDEGTFSTRLTLH